MSDEFHKVSYKILLCIPAEPLFRFRSVCKTWLRIIDDIIFIKKHLHRQQCGDNIILRNYTGKLYLLPLSSLDCSTNHKKSIALTNIKNLVGLGVPRILTLPVLSHSGLILLTHKDESKAWTLWNPFTQESFELPNYDHLLGEYIGFSSPCAGIGYDCITNDFKVVRIVTHEEFCNREKGFMLGTLVYSLRFNYWKRIDNFVGCRKPEFTSFKGVFVNWALHWIADVIPKGQQASTCIIAFDIGTETDRVLPRPSFLSEGQSVENFALDVFGGCLCLRNNGVIWIMKNYGENVWTELVSLKKLREKHSRMGSLRPIAYIKSKGQILFEQNNEGFVLFDVEKDCVKQIRIEGFAGDFTSQVFPSSLFRLNRSGGDDEDDSDDYDNESIASNGTTLKRKRKPANKRLKVTLEIGDVRAPSPLWIGSSYCGYSSKYIVHDEPL